MLPYLKFKTPYNEPVAPKVESFSLINSPKFSAIRLDKNVGAKEIDNLQKRRIFWTPATFAKNLAPKWFFGGELNIHLKCYEAEKSFWVPW